MEEIPSLSQLSGMVEGKAKQFAKNMVDNFATVALVLVCTFFLTYSFTDMSLLDFTVESGVSFCADSIVLFICYMIVSRAYTEKGYIAGKKDPEYLRLRSAVLNYSNKIHAEGDSDELVEFVDEYKTRELDRVRAAIIHNCHGTEEEYHRYLDGNKKDIPLRRRSAYRRVYELRPIVLTADRLMEADTSSTLRGGLPIDVAEATSRNARGDIVRTAITVFFVSTLAFHIVTDPSIATFAECLIRLVGIVMRCFLGYIEGVRVYDTVAVRYHTAQLSKLHLFEEWKKAKGESVKIAEAEIERKGERKDDARNSVRGSEVVPAEFA